MKQADLGAISHLSVVVAAPSDLVSVTTAASGGVSRFLVEAKALLIRLGGGSSSVATPSPGQGLAKSLHLCKKLGPLGPAPE